ncbi:MAG: hypothetical protein IGR76_04720 [Synechococcales cyanobacterium T60_A2020_003]|nr:hypothetical protein [Synechococcales cyanobacterium T60_A2020_003]
MKRPLGRQNGNRGGRSLSLYDHNKPSIALDNSVHTRIFGELHHTAALNQTYGPTF